VNLVQTKINWVGLAGGVTTIAVIIVSLFYPWWLFTAGENLVRANVSPFNTNFSFLGTTFTIPLIYALNIASLLTLAASGIAMLIYSVMPTKTYSKHLLGFAYKKPLISLVFFVIVLFAITIIFQALFGINVPLEGSYTANLPENLTLGLTISVLISAGFQWPFWLAAVAAGLCIAARFYHKRVATPAQAVPAATAPSSAPPTVPAS
jgi:hypothetical protein